MSLATELIEDGRRPRPGQGVRLIVRQPRAERYNVGVQDDLSIGTQFHVTRVYRATAMVRTVETWRTRSGYNTVRRSRSYILPLSVLDYDEGVTERPTSRKLGTKPDDTDDITYIGIDHPGIQWLWEDMGRYASRQHWCREYDALAANLGIPGRPQEYRVSVRHNGITLNAMITARSESEAQEKLRLSLLPSPETAPSDQAA